MIHGPGDRSVSRIVSSRSNSKEEVVAIIVGGLTQTRSVIHGTLRVSILDAKALLPCTLQQLQNSGPVKWRRRKETSDDPADEEQGCTDDKDRETRYVVARIGDIVGDVEKRPSKYAACAEILNDLGGQGRNR